MTSSAATVRRGMRLRRAVAVESGEPAHVGVVLTRLLETFTVSTSELLLTCLTLTLSHLVS